MRRACPAPAGLVLAALGLMAAGPADPQRFIAPSGQLFTAAADAPYPVVLWVAAADADGDGRLTRAEFLADALRYFARLDSDGDGELDGFEVAAYEQEVLRPLRAPMPGAVPTGGERTPDRPPTGSPPRGAPLTAGHYGLIDAPQPVKAADSDVNARVTEDEYRKLILARFAALDGAGQGFLTLATLPETPAQKAARLTVEGSVRR